MPWQAHLSLDYTHEAPRTVARFRHDGPLRILQSLYPEGDAICHNVMVHPPGGLVGGDTLDIAVSVAEGAHGLISTPGATRFYRSAQDEATQNVVLRLAPGARLEWLPLETIAYSACRAVNRMTLEIAPGAELIAWDCVAFGLPAANAPFVSGRYLQHLQWPGVWLERAQVRAEDQRLLDSPLGMAGHRCMATMVVACGTAMTRDRREMLLDVLRAQEPPATDGTLHWGVTAPNDHMITVRVLAPVVEPAMQLLRGLWAAVRPRFWNVGAQPPRIWSV